MITDFEALAAEDRRDIPMLVVPELPPRRPWFVVPRLAGIVCPLVGATAMLVEPHRDYLVSGQGSAARWHWLLAAAIAYLVLGYRERRTESKLELQRSSAAADLATGIAAFGCLLVGIAVVLRQRTHGDTSWLYAYANPFYAGSMALALIMTARAIGGSLRPREALIEPATMAQFVALAMFVTAFGVLLFAQSIWSTEVVPYERLPRVTVRDLHVIHELVRYSLLEVGVIVGGVVFAVTREHLRGASRVVAFLEWRGTAIAALGLGGITLVIYTNFVWSHRLATAVTMCASGAFAVTTLIAHLALRRRRRLLSLYSASPPASTTSGS